MDVRNIQKLENMGLSRHEAQVYLSLLELGRGTVTQISQASQLNRTTGYDILERLSLYGLASRAGSGTKRKMYSAEPPVRLKQFLESKKTQAERRLEEVGEILSDLHGLYRGESKPVIKFFEGREGIKNIYLHTLEARSVIYSVLDLGVYLPEFDQFGRDYIRERTRRKIKEQALVVKNEAGLDYYNSVYKNNKRNQEITEYRWLEKGYAFPTAAEVNIYDDIVMGVLVRPGENAAFEVQNESFANSLKIIFELAWKQGEVIK
ncbi:MAG: helix-turn-helix domain-containing protein [bacterium]|nr:helix-turn-helix domain-containing protein [bacterium]